MPQVGYSTRVKSHFSVLEEMRVFGDAAITIGLSDPVVHRFIATDRVLAVAIERAYGNFLRLKDTHPDYLALDERTQIQSTQDGITNFYASDAVNPYTVGAAAGPWIVTLKGAVVYDCGGYGMLGFGHAPEFILDAMNKPHVMANIMTANTSQMNFVECMRLEVGHARRYKSPYDSFVCLNSGSEAMSLASRIADTNAGNQTRPGARHNGHEVYGLALSGSFHGRTDRPARYSDSTRKTYEAHLASFRERTKVLTVGPNNTPELEAVFAKAHSDRIFIEALFMEPVMGEGNPGLSITPEFYARARTLTQEHGSMLVIDSIQAGLRAHGVLSIVDYPGFESLDEPDMESYSKALNAGQFPISVLALSAKAAETYQQGLYGNTMTSNPRGLDVVAAVLRALSPERRNNIRNRGQEMVRRLDGLAEELDGAITGVQGTGLLFSCELDSRYKVYGSGSIEEHLRTQGLGAIHGGERSLRFTPHFDIGEDEVNLIIELIRDALVNGPRRS